MTSSMDNQKQCMVSRKAVAQGFQIRHFLRAAPEDGALSGWVFLYGDEDAKYSGNFDNYVTVKLKTIIEHNPCVSPYLDFPEGSEFIVDENKGQVIPLHEEEEPAEPEAPAPKQEALVLEQEEYPKAPEPEKPPFALEQEDYPRAPEPPKEETPLPPGGKNPENQEVFGEDFKPRRAKMPKVSINPLVWATHYPIWPAMTGLSFIPAVLIMTLASKWMGGALLGLCVLGTVFYWISVYSRFRNARVLPAIVISASPPMAAVTMDLEKGQSKRPAVRILEFPATKSEQESLKTGLRLPAAAKRIEQKGKDGKPYWADFSFVLMNCAVSDKKALSQLLRSFPDRQWEELESRIAMLPPPYEPGLYTMPDK